MSSVTWHLSFLFLQVNSLVSTPPGELGSINEVDSPPSTSIHPLPKQQNLPQRPTSLHLLPKIKETTSASSRLKLEKLKSNHRQVQVWSDGLDCTLKFVLDYQSVIFCRSWSLSHSSLTHVYMSTWSCRAADFCVHNIQDRVTLLKQQGIVVVWSEFMFSADGDCDHEVPTVEKQFTVHLRSSSGQ